MNNFPRLNWGFHTPALLKEAVSALNVRPNGKYIDATIGGGGHSAEIIRRGGKVLGIDQDEDAIEYIKKNQESGIENQELVLTRGNFKDIERIARERGFVNADGVLFDLGFSSYQMEKSGKGFSFLRDEPLDMRMSIETKLTARDIVNSASRDELYNIFSKFGEEKNAYAFCDSIVRARSIKPIETSRELAEIVARASGTHLRGVTRLHPATRVFQALRIAVNSEIDNLKEGLAGAFEILAPNGRLIVISFHSLEDRVVKLFFARLAREGRAILANKKPIVPSEEEIKANRRARSAKLRILEKITNS
ncbi:MAG: 16S rRNA (cytosine(1402)-N(4))-methyltransferase [Candidatus Levybacteria bacterium RIFCSPHIGHO2_02_FULL_40_18]|nr:MAG: 16S rRNA (cytosine(1402)-N(4))-methyltransferase [Candidatus Levybacteria bacterium RIFCSPHIGHO2_01_FULL_40_58]OGH27148.1 MAG: 16S rRNA (cytosine(1402)-N(4))-methyltransferase [Candidatus Levybacteria bacterium RIFCSPHIGHO2_02_FULL_40_18]OGH31007.1 MAG: 16S rRNA (cytosine(1402)-N(4))-methyltransferase [Candidatus Levybacteria bacterium RIFCSPHIGHO2_12_FULL_40_31]OGH41018.1 MAG: 16S rRNA (cytosine(1402)-N(4))-methyltransferase [Candidatus Levybacteria bacterium RIFCSPLOWO2_01_FULL_40_64]